MSTLTLLDQLTLIGDHFDDCVVLVEMDDPRRRCLYANDKFSASTGFSASDTVGRNLAFLQGENTSAEAVEFMRLALDACQACCIDLLNYRADGKEFLNRLVILPLVSQGEGYFIGFQNVLGPAAAGQSAHATISHGEINHVLRSPLTALLLKVETALQAQIEPRKALTTCRDTFVQINSYCRNIDKPETFSTYNPFR